jgi:Domain of unknown function (DUF3601).
LDRKHLDKKYSHLIAGRKYTISKSFRDYDNYPYEQGNVIEFIGSNFVPYEDGLSLFCIYKDREKQIRLQIRPEEQEEIAHNIQDYLVPVGE